MAESKVHVISIACHLKTYDLVPSSIDYFVGQGFNSFRIPFQQERLSPPGVGMTGAFDATYLNGLKTVRNYHFCYVLVTQSYSRS